VRPHASPNRDNNLLPLLKGKSAAPALAQRVVCNFPFSQCGRASSVYSFFNASSYAARCGKAATDVMCAFAAYCTRSVSLLRSGEVSYTAGSGLGV
jgi:hypothetical protein